jgi:hypothetical protein
MMNALVLDYFDKAIATYDRDPPRNDYQRGHLDSLKVARAELAQLLDGASTAMRDIATERQRQIEAEGWTPEHDDQHADGALAQAAACYAMGDHRIVAWSHDGRNWGEASLWPWHEDWWKPASRRRNLIKSAALIAAEIERLDRTKVAA